MAIQKNHSIFCTELNTGMNLTGSFYLSDDLISARIYSYDQHFHFRRGEPIFLMTEDGDLISLHSYTGAAASQNSRLFEPIRTAYISDIKANGAIIGQDFWKSEDQVRRVIFAVKHADELVHHQEKLSTLGKLPSRNLKPENLTLFRIEAGGMHLSLHYDATLNRKNGFFDSFRPIFSIEFGEPVGINDYLIHVSNYVSFVSFCLGISLKPSNIRIGKLSTAEALLAMNSVKFRGEHSAHYIWQAHEFRPHDCWVGGSPVRAWDDDELSAFQMCLVAWMGRSQKWNNAYPLMEICLESKGTFLSDRLVNACRWFEELPDFASRPAISDTDLDTIVTAAAKAAQDLGLARDLRTRITGQLKAIRSESRQELFERLTNMLQSKFGEECWPGDAIPHLMRAYIFRGRAAHGHFSPSDESETSELYQAVTSLEALCTLLTAYDLPLNQSGIERMKHNSVVRDFWHARL